MTYNQIVRKYSKELRGITHIPAKEVEILILHIEQQNTIWLHLNYDKECHCENELKKLVLKRATNYPLEYITKRVSFYGEIFNITDGVLIPRPETELLVEKAEQILLNISDPTILEIGTGSGIISVMLATLVKNIKIIAVDINDKALALAKSNAKQFGVEDKIEFIKSDLFSNIDQSIDFDMVVSNPPYIAANFKLPQNVKYEPSNALFGGKVGDELLKDIIDITVQKNINYLLCEMGYDQKKPLANYFKGMNNKVETLEFYKDYENLDRGFVVKFKE